MAAALMSTTSAVTWSAGAMHPEVLTSKTWHGFRIDQVAGQRILHDRPQQRIGMTGFADHCAMLNQADAQRFESGTSPGVAVLHRLGTTAIDDEELHRVLAP